MYITKDSDVLKTFNKNSYFKTNIIAVNQTLGLKKILINRIYVTHLFL